MAFHALIVWFLSRISAPVGPATSGGALRPCRARAAPAPHEGSPYEPQRMDSPRVNPVRPCGLGRKASSAAPGTGGGGCDASEAGQLAPGLADLCGAERAEVGKD